MLIPVGPVLTGQIRAASRVHPALAATLVIAALEQRLIGGVQGEVHWYLGTGNGVTIKVLGPLRDQSARPGPIVCD